jgi:hypothetical protein
MTVLGVFVITPALPEIREQFGVTSRQVGIPLIINPDMPAENPTPCESILCNTCNVSK